MKIHCNIAKDLMPLYIDDALSEESKAAVEEHLTGCEGCREYYRRMHGSEIPDAEAEAEEVLSRLDEAERLKRLKRKMLLKRIVTIAATAAVVILIIIVGDILVFHNPNYIPYNDTGIRMTENGDRIAVFFLTSSYYSRNWEKVSDINEKHVMRFHETEDADAVDKVYYLPEKYVKENRLDGFFSAGRTIFDHIYSQSRSLNEEQMQEEMNKLISGIEDEATLVWSKE